MFILASRLRGSRSGYALGVAVKVVGVGIFVALMLTYCNVLLDACIRGIH